MVSPVGILTRCPPSPVTFLRVGGRHRSLYPQTPDMSGPPENALVILWLGCGFWFANCAGRRGWRVETRGEVSFACWLTTLISRGGVVLKLPHFSWWERTRYRSVISTRTNSLRKKSHPWSILRILLNRLRVETRGRGRFEHLFISSVGMCRAFLHRHYYLGSSV